MANTNATTSTYSLDKKVSSLIASGNALIAKTEATLLEGAGQLYCLRCDIAEQLTQNRDDEALRAQLKRIDHVLVAIDRSLGIGTVR
jgi:hypothetical protein